MYLNLSTLTLTYYPGPTNGIVNLVRYGYTTHPIAYRNKLKYDTSGRGAPARPPAGEYELARIGTGTKVS
eukprot:SAG31_NODE_33159_length_347_cov_0.657258_1_plen_69_part_10